MKSSTGIGITLVLLACFLSTGATPTPEYPALIPSEDPIAEIFAARVITEASGAKRLEGQFYLIARPGFELGDLKGELPEIELIMKVESRRGGTISLVGRVPEARLADAILLLRARPGVIAVAKHGLFQPTDFPNDPYFPAQQALGLSLLNLPAAWDLTEGISSVRVAVLDSGVNPAPDLFPQLDTGINFVAIPPSTNTADFTGHGTSVASVIGATRGNGTHIAGVAPGARIVPVTVCGLFDCPGILVERGLEWVWDQGNIQVVNISLGITDQQSPISYYIDLLTTEGVIVVASAGNQGDSELPFPASNDDVVSVGGSYCFRDTTPVIELRSRPGPCRSVRQLGNQHLWIAGDLPRNLSLRTGDRRPRGVIQEHVFGRPISVCVLAVSGGRRHLHESGRRVERANGPRRP